MRYLYNPEFNRCVPYSEDFAANRPDFIEMTADEIVQLRNGRPINEIISSRVNAVRHQTQLKSEVPASESARVGAEEGIVYGAPRRRGRRRISN